MQGNNVSSATGSPYAAIPDTWEGGVFEVPMVSSSEQMTPLLRVLFERAHEYRPNGDRSPPGGDAGLRSVKALRKALLTGRAAPPTIVT